MQHLNQSFYWERNHRASCIQILFICCFSTLWSLRFPPENLPCVLQPQEAVGHNPLLAWVTQSFSNNINWEKLRPESFLLHSVRPMWTFLKVMPKSETLDLIIIYLWSWSGVFTHPVALSYESSPTRVRWNMCELHCHLTLGRSVTCAAGPELCLSTPEAYTAQGSLQESCKSQQGVLPSNDVIWLFCMGQLNCKAVLHKLLPKLHISS